MTTASAVAQRLIDARSAAALIDEIDPPQTADDAMIAQRLVADAIGAQAGGWKVAIGADATPLVAPMFAGDIRKSPARWPLTPVLAIELEIAYRLDRDLPPAPYTRLDIVGAISEAIIGVEVVGPRLRAGARAPFLAFLADNLGNGGYVEGPRIADWTDLDPAALRCAVTINGVGAYAGPARHAQGDPLRPLVAYASKPNDRLGGLRAGQIVTTGNLCGVIPVPQTGEVVCEIEGLGRVVLIVE